ncbi:MAG: N-acetylmuramoyl-L-alanine amidase [Prevotellaceae bacterium]|jgi:N-acetylmuramoyl-L-alanine amidase|nr:N-acetylmuramoyl-L-alanine amidase [Prevotellaceae bacterium]
MLIKNGIIGDTTINGVAFFTQIVQVKRGGNGVRTCQQRGNPAFIVVHNTGNTTVGAGALNHAKYLQNCENDPNGDIVGYHFVVDNKAFYQLLPLDEKAWHASDGADGDGNSRGVAIEICENSDGDYSVAESNAVKLIFALQAHFSIDNAHVKPHRFFATATKKLCPHLILKSEATWVADWDLWVAKNLVVKAETGVLYKVQVGAFAEKKNAEKLVAELKTKGYTTIIIEVKT